METLCRDLVPILPLEQWPLGRIIESFSGKEGHTDESQRSSTENRLLCDQFTNWSHSCEVA